MGKQVPGGSASRGGPEMKGYFDELMKGVDLAVLIGIIVGIGVFWNGWTKMHLAWCGWALLIFFVGIGLVFLRFWLEDLLTRGRT